MLSKSQIKTYENCKRAWWYYKVEKITSIPNAYMQKGIALHRFFESIYDEDVSDYSKLIGACSSSPFYDAYSKEIDSFAQAVVDYGYNKPVHREKHLTLPEEKIHGIIDRVDLKDGKTIMYDYKTGFFKSFSLNNYKFELALYSYLVEKCLDVKVDSWGVIFVTGWKSKFVSEPYDKFLVENTLERIKAVRKDIEERRKEGKSAFPKNKCSYCNYCPYKKHCIRDRD